VRGAKPEVLALPRFARDVLTGLADPVQKYLSAQYFYDAVGSALFEAITALPEYGLTRADARLLERHAHDIVALANGQGDRPGCLSYIELGSGSGLKTRWILEAAASAVETSRGAVEYTPIDVSAAALEMCRAALETIPGVRVAPRNATYLEGLRDALAGRRAGERVLVLFLGSTIGNFAPSDAINFLTEVRRLLEPHDSLLLGTDLVKPLDRLLPAYDDPTGVTAAFNRNLLARINRELGGDFDLRAFEHEVRFDAAESRIEMHLRATRPLEVQIEALGRQFQFHAGETIWTEASYKFTEAGIRDLARSSGFHCARQWIDGEWPFAETLLQAA
jgi:dimethylhistidine N-methyltransferase